MSAAPHTLRAPLGFTRAEDVLPDPEWPGLLRARTRPVGADPHERLDFRSCALHDCAGESTPEPGLEAGGFESADLAGNAPLQRALAAVREADRVSEEAAAALRAALVGATLPLANGGRLCVLHVAAEGLIQRRAGPCGLDVNPGGMDGANGHGAAQAVHADQDVFGTPLRQLMKGEAPQRFRHHTHDAHNDQARLHLLNLWIPIQQVTRPLVLMDRRSLDARRHQLRYGLPVTRFLDRDAERSVNDIWTFLPDPGQRWYFRSEMGPDRGWVFDTLGAPHGACILPGEDALLALYETLGRACEAARAGDAASLQAIAGAPRPPLPEVTTEPVRAAWRRMAALLDEARRRAAPSPGASAAWVARAQAARDAVVRKSVEMRLVATPDPRRERA